MATARRPSSEGLVEAVELPPEPPLQPSVRGSVQQQQRQQQPPLQASARGSVQHQPQQQQPSGWAAEGVPVALATMNPLAYIGVPVDDNDNHEKGSSSRAAGSPTPPPPGYGGTTGAGTSRVHGDVSLGVGRDFAGAEEHARASARRDNEDFCERKRFTESQARSRVAEDLRAIEVARINAKRRDAEGLDMRPHPGNRLEPEPEGGVLGEKAAFAYVGAGDGGGVGKSSGKQEVAGAGAGEGGEQEEAVSSSGGYQCAEYVPAEYVIPEYKSMYGTPPET